ncbi:unnamed protein product [Arctogadus glacialis]
MLWARLADSSFSGLLILPLNQTHLRIIFIYSDFSSTHRQIIKQSTSTISPPQRCSSTAFLDTTLTRLASCIN